MGLTFQKKETYGEIFAKYAVEPTTSDSEAGKNIVGKVRAEQKGITLSKIEVKKVDQQQIDQERQEMKIIK